MRAMSATSRSTALRILLVSRSSTCSAAPPVPMWTRAPSRMRSLSGLRPASTTREGALSSVSSMRDCGSRTRLPSTSVPASVNSRSASGSSTCTPVRSKIASDAWWIRLTCSSVSGLYCPPTSPLPGPRCFLAIRHLTIQPATAPVRPPKPRRAHNRRRRSRRRRPE